MDTLRWGILSTARIAEEKVIPAMQQGQYVDVVAIASRDQARAEASAERLGLPRAHGSYEALLADPEVDAVYIPLPNHLHVPWSIRALEAGKHVLCEKPIGLDAAEAQTLADVARQHPGLKVMEAFMYRFHPQWQRAYDLVQDGAIGTLRTIQTFFSYFNDDPNNVRNQAGIGGGGLMDIGCYAVSLARWLFGAEPQRVLGWLEVDPRFEVDRLASGILDFDAGTATFTVGTQLARHQRVEIVGTEGRVEIEIPFNAPPDRGCTIWLQQGHRLEEIVLEPADQYTLQGDAFSKAVLNGADVPTPLTDAVANMEVLDALFESAEQDRWMKMEEKR